MALVLALVVSFVFVGGLIARLRRHEAVSEGRTMIGKTGVVKSELVPLGDITVEGFGWRAQLLGSERAEAGERIRVVSADRNLLHVRKVEPSEKATTA
jgi:membrane protein implicated in regulation of membrane protease activity